MNGLGSVLSTMQEELSGKIDSLTNPYEKFKAEMELDALKRLNGLDTCLYLARLLDYDVDAYRQEAANAIDAEIDGLSKQIDDNCTNICNYEKDLNIINLSMDDFSKRIKRENFPEEISAADYEKWVSLFGNLNANSDKRHELNRSIHDLKESNSKLEAKKNCLIQRKTIIQNGSSEELQKDFINANRERLQRIGELITRDISLIDKPIYELMQTKDGYDFLQKKLCIFNENIEKKGYPARIQFNTSFIPSLSSFLRGSGFEPDAIHKFSLEKLKKVQKDFSDYYSSLPLLREKMMLFNPLDYIEIVNSGDTKSNIAIELITRIPIAEDDPMYKEYSMLRYSFEYAIGVYRTKRRKAFFSKEQRREASEYYTGEVQFFSDCIIEFFHEYFLQLYQDIIFSIGSSAASDVSNIEYIAENYNYYVREFKNFARGIKSLVAQVNTCVRDYENQIVGYNSAIDESAREIFEQAGYAFYRKGDCDFDVGEINPRTSYEKVYMAKIARDVDNKIIEYFENQLNRASTNIIPKCNVPVFKKVPINMG